MDNIFLFNNILLFILFIINIIIKEKYIYFILIYSSLFLYNIYALYIIIKAFWGKKNNFIFKFIFLSLLLYIFTYFLIYDPNPLFYLFTYYLFFPDFFKAVVIIVIHTYYISKLTGEEAQNEKIKYNYAYSPLSTNENNSVKGFGELQSNNNNTTMDVLNNYYFLSNYIDCLKKDKIMFFIYLFIIFLIIIIDIKLFFQRNKIWVLFNSKKNTLPISTSKNTTFYITAMIANMEKSINIYINEMKKLINYLGEENIIVSIVENGDSKDKTAYYLNEFQDYLNQKNIRNNFILTHVIKDPRKNETNETNITTIEEELNDLNQTMNETQFQIFTHLRIEYFAKLRNKCFDLLYEIPDIDYNNTKIIYFNDIMFEYEDIINLLSKNNEDYDAVCGLDFDDHFYDTWVSIDLNGNGLRHGFPYFINKEAQDLVINHKPIRVFSCWNGVIVFNALPLKDKKIQFRSEIDYNRTVKYSINTDQQFSYESECTYFHIDLYELGFTKKFINPEVRFAYIYRHYRKKKKAYPNFTMLFNYIINYFLSFTENRNKYMSNYKDKDIKLSSNLENWYIYNKKKLSINDRKN